MRISDWSSDVCSSDRLPKPRHYTRLSFCWVNPWCCSYSQPNVVDVPAGVLEPHSVCNLSANLSYDGLIEIKQHDVRKEASCNQAMGKGDAIELGDARELLEAGKLAFVSFLPGPIETTASYVEIVRATGRTSVCQWGWNSWVDGKLKKPKK